jgi:hypothetical protein
MAQSWHTNMPLVYAQLPEPGSGPVTGHECSHLMREGRAHNDQGPEPCGEPATRLVLIGNPPGFIRRYRCAEHLAEVVNRLELDVSIATYQVIDLTESPDARP